MYPSLGCTAGQLLCAKPQEKPAGRLEGITQCEPPDGICGRSESPWCGLCFTLPPWGIPNGYKRGGVEDDWEVPRITMVSCKPHMWGRCRVLGGTFSPSCRGSDDDGEEESAAQGSRQTHDNLYRVHMPSLYSCGSSYGSETSIPAAAHTVSNAPVTEYMWVSPLQASPHCLLLISVGSSAARLALVAKW